eukprot:6235911-Amphidinium_carterae.1
MSSLTRKLMIQVEMKQMYIRKLPPVMSIEMSVHKYQQKSRVVRLGGCSVDGTMVCCKHASQSRSIGDWLAGDTHLRARAAIRCRPP